MSNERLLKAMARYFEVWGAANSEDNIGQQVACAAGEIERGELPDHVVAMFRRANELRAWHKARNPGPREREGAAFPADPRSTELDENWAPLPESTARTPSIRADMIALINVAQQALDSLIVERIELVRLNRSTHDVDMTIGAARKQLAELHWAALEHANVPLPGSSDRRQSGGDNDGR